jgi:Tol biopolymer transport system component
LNGLRIVRLAMGTALVVTTTAVIGVPSGSAVNKPLGGTLVLASASGAPGVPVSLRGRIPTHQRTRVELQRLDVAGFVAVTVATTDRRGRFSFTTNVPDDRATASYRVSSENVVTPIRSVVTGTTTRLTQDPDQTKEPEGRIGSWDPVISGDGRFVAFASALNVFGWDRSSGLITRISPDSEHGNGFPSISKDGRYVAYVKDLTYFPVQSRACDVMLWDRTTGTTTQVTHGNKGSFSPSISGDGRFITFASDASDLVSHDTNKRTDVFVWDRSSGSTRRITNGNDDSFIFTDEYGGSAISDTGRHIIFGSHASDLVPGDNNDEDDMFVWDRRTGNTRRVLAGDSRGAVISGDGRFIAYTAKSDPVRHDGHERRFLDVYVWDRATRTTHKLTDSNGNSKSPSISADGRQVVYASHSSTLTPGLETPNASADVFVWDRMTGTTTRITVTTGEQNALDPAISGDGEHVVYENGQLDGINGPPDVYLWDVAP